MNFRWTINPLTTIRIHFMSNKVTYKQVSFGGGGVGGVGAGNIRIFYKILVIRINCVSLIREYSIFRYILK